MSATAVTASTPSTLVLVGVHMKTSTSKTPFDPPGYPTALPCSNSVGTTSGIYHVYCIRKGFILHVDSDLFPYCVLADDLMIQSQVEHELKTIEFDHTTLLSAASLNNFSEITFVKIAACLETHIDTWLCKDHIVKVVFTKAAYGDNAAVQLSATVPAFKRPSIESFLELQLEEPGTETKLTVRDVLGLDCVTGSQLMDARRRNTSARQILARTDLQVRRERKRKVRLRTDDLDKHISDLTLQIGDSVVEGRKQASTKRYLVGDGMLSNDVHGIIASDVGNANFAGAAVWVTWWSRSSNG